MWFRRHLEFIPSEMTNYMLNSGGERDGGRSIICSTLLLCAPFVFYVVYKYVRVDNLRLASFASNWLHSDLRSRLLISQEIDIYCKYFLNPLSCINYNFNYSSIKWFSQSVSTAAMISKFYLKVKLKYLFVPSNLASEKRFPPDEETHSNLTFERNVFIYYKYFI